MYAVVIEQVTVIFPDVLLNNVIVSPVVNVASGIVIDPPVPTSINLSTSPISNV